jgi:hypothetical protein
MASIPTQAGEKLDQVARTEGFTVKQSGSGIKVTNTETGASETFSGTPASQRALANMNTRLRRVGWTTALYEKQQQQDRAKRLARDRDRHETKFGDLLTHAQQQIAGIEPVHMSGGITMTPEVVTPEMALEYLTRNKAEKEREGDYRQRPVSKRLVRKFAESIRREEWVFSHQGIALDREGRLFDGQHRLEAVLEAMAPIPLAVWRGIDPANFTVVDIGKTRTVGDMLHISGEGYSALLGAMLRVIYLWESGIDQERWPETIVSPAQIMEMLERHPEIRESAPMANSARKLGMTPTAAAVGHYLIRKAWPEAPVEEFYRKLAIGAGLEPGSPTLALRNYLLGQKSRRTALRAEHRSTKGVFHLHLLIRVWNAECEGRLMRRLSWKEPIRIPQPYAPSPRR